MTFKAKCRRIWSELYEVKIDLARIQGQLVLAAHDSGKTKELFAILDKKETMKNKKGPDGDLFELRDILPGEKA